MDYSEFMTEGKNKVQSYFLEPPTLDEILLKMEYWEEGCHNEL